MIHSIFSHYLYLSILSSYLSYHIFIKFPHPTYFYFRLLENTKFYAIKSNSGVWHIAKNKIPNNCGIHDKLKLSSDEYIISI